MTEPTVRRHCEFLEGGLSRYLNYSTFPEVLAGIPTIEDPTAHIVKLLAERQARQLENLGRWGLRTWATTNWRGRPIWFRCVEQPQRIGFITAPVCKVVLRYQWPE